jgi:hypothetical protein
MTRRQIQALFDFTVNAVTLTLDPTGGPPKDELPDEPEPGRTVTAVIAAAPNQGPIVEPAMRAVNGYIRITDISGYTRRLYVGHGPDFIAEQLRHAIRCRRPMYKFWDRPGYADAQLRWIATSLVIKVEVERLEADVEALYDDLSYEFVR